MSGAERWAPPEEMRAVVPPFLLEAAQLMADAHGSVRVVRNLRGITIDCPKNPGVEPIIYKYGENLEAKPEYRAAKLQSYDPGDESPFPSPEFMKLMGDAVRKAAEPDA